MIWASSSSTEMHGFHHCQNQKVPFIFFKCLSLSWSKVFRGFDEDYVNDEENALTASFSKSRNLEDMTQFPSNFSVIKTY